MKKFLSIIFVIYILSFVACSSDTSSDELKDSKKGIITQMEENKNKSPSEKPTTTPTITPTVTPEPTKPPVSLINTAEGTTLSGYPLTGNMIWYDIECRGGIYTGYSMHTHFKNAEFIYVEPELDGDGLYQYQDTVGILNVSKDRQYKVYAEIGRGTFSDELDGYTKYDGKTIGYSIYDDAEDYDIYYLYYTLVDVFYIKFAVYVTDSLVVEDIQNALFDFDYSIVTYSGTKCPDLHLKEDE